MELDYERITIRNISTINQYHLFGEFWWIRIYKLKFEGHM